MEYEKSNDDKQEINNGNLKNITIVNIKTENGLTALDFTQSDEIRELFTTR